MDIFELHFFTAIPILTVIFLAIIFHIFKVKVTKYHSFLVTLSVITIVVHDFSAPAI